MLKSSALGNFIGKTGVECVPLLRSLWKRFGVNMRVDLLEADGLPKLLVLEGLLCNNAYL